MHGHERSPRINESEDAQTPERDSAYTDLFGPIVGTFTPTSVTGGSDPQYIRRAWEGVALPIRQRTVEIVLSGSVVLVSANEALDVLSAVGTPQPVLKYWQECSISDELATIAFSLKEGELLLR